jgi:hypothetical protein
VPNPAELDQMGAAALAPPRGGPVLTTSARKPPLRSARFEAEIALLPFSPRRFGPVTRFVVAREGLLGDE